MIGFMESVQEESHTMHTTVTFFGIQRLGCVSLWRWEIVDLIVVPNLLMFHPSLAKSLLEYRFLRIPAAALKAQSENFSGIMYPWYPTFHFSLQRESGFTGSEVCPWDLAALYEQHISGRVMTWQSIYLNVGDISFACRQYFYASYDLDWLKNRGKKNQLDVIKRISYHRRSSWVLGIESSLEYFIRSVWNLRCNASRWVRRRG